MKHLFLAGFLCTSLFAFVLSASAASDDVDMSQLIVHFDTIKNTMYFHKVGWFKNADYPVKYFNGNWRWQATDGKWHSLLTPFVTKWNKKYHLILNTGGRIVVSMKDNSSNFEIRLIRGTWCYNVDQDWFPLDDMYEQ